MNGSLIPEERQLDVCDTNLVTNSAYLLTRVPVLSNVYKVAY